MKILKRTLLVIVSVIVLLISTLFIIGKFYKDEVINLIVSELNKQLITPVSVGKIDFSLLAKFPSASIQFSDLKIKEASESKTKDNLIAAKSLFLEFNIFNILSGNYKIKNIHLSNGVANIKTFGNGKNNFKIWKSDSTSAGKGNVNFNLQKIYLENVHFTYSDFNTNLHTAININKAKASGDFNEKNYLLKIDGNLMGEDLKINETTYLRDKPVQLNIKLNVENNEKFIFEESQITIQELAFTVSGNVLNDTKAQTVFDLNIKSKDIKIAALLKLLPAKYIKDIKDFDSDGFITSEIIIKGNSDSPKLDAKFTIDDGCLLNTDSDIKLEHIYLNGNYSNGKERTGASSSLILNNFKATLQQGQINGNLAINNFNSPNLKAKANANLSLKALKEFFKIDTLSNLEGNLIMNLSYSGPLKTNGKFTSDDLNNCVINGGFTLQNAAVAIQNNPKTFKNINGEFIFNNSDLVINSLSAALFTSVFDLKGRFKNLLPFILNDGERLDVVADLSSNNVNLEEIFSNNTSKTSNEQFNLKFSDKIDFDLTTALGKITFRKFTAGDFTGKFSLHDQKLSAENVKFRAMDGHIALSGVVDGTTPVFKVICEAKTDKISIQKMFYQVENFGQNYIEDKNLRGALTADIIFKCDWDNHLNADFNTLNAKSNITIEKGELLNFDPLLHLSKFIDVSELKNVKFNTLKNTVEISNRTITIPQMEISSNALNISLSGTQTFEGKLDYHFKVLLNDLLAKKARVKKENTEFGEEEDDGLGKITLYLSMTGTTTNPKFSYDKKGFKARLKDDVKTESKSLKGLLNKEFGLFKKDTTLNKNKKPKEKELGLDFGSNKKQDPDNKQKEDKKEPKKENKLLKKIKKNGSEKSDENSDDYN